MFDMESVITTLAPELLLAAAGLIGVLAGAIIGDRFNAISFKLGAVVLFAAAILSGFYWEGGRAFDGLVETSAFVNLAKIVSFVAAGLALLMAESFLERHQTQRYEYSLLVIFAALGMGTILSSADLMTLYLGIEMLSLSSYVLASFHRDSPRSAEAGLKYFVLGALASGMLLYGISLVYGFSGGTSYEALASADPTIGFMFGMVLMIVGLAFKVSAAPMHVWTPDVYEGSPSPVVAFFATAPKMASMVVFVVIMLKAFSSGLDTINLPLVVGLNWQLIIAIVAAASMLVGAFGALIQDNIKRLLGYSSVANMGYALVALSAAAYLPEAVDPSLFADTGSFEAAKAASVAAAQAVTTTGASAIMIFMTAYVIASLGLFGGVLSMRRDGGMVENKHELAGLVRHKPALAIALTVLLVSVSGFPLAFGFIGKLSVIEAAAMSGLLPLIIILIISSVIAMYYYLYIVKIMWFDEPAEVFEPVGGMVTFVVYLTAIASIALFIFVAPFSELAADAAASLLS
ncbi:MAG: NADH-quinone oxidoreductase subunit N [Henriciella sp.]|nr:NADH-quinone oxidoreductase subunit N [Henriciella sp.]